MLKSGAFGEEQIKIFASNMILFFKRLMENTNQI